MASPRVAHVRPLRCRRAKEKHRNRHTCACAGTAPCLAHVGARHGEHPPGTWPAGRTCATPTVLVGKGEPPEPAFTCVCRNSAMPGARRGSPWRAPFGHTARGSHMCDPYGVADEGKPPAPAYTCVCRNSAMPGARRGSPRRAPSGHMARGSHMCDPYGVGGQRRSTGTGIHVRVPEQRHAWRT